MDPTLATALTPVLDADPSAMLLTTDGTTVAPIGGLGDGRR